MRNKLILLALLLTIFGLILQENLTKRPADLPLTTSGQVEMCLSCHKEEKLDPAHDAKVLGCAACHLGDRLAIAKEPAHKGIVKNPGDLRVVEKTCGVEGCHGADVIKVKNSLMATNRGILATLRYYWGEAPHQDGNFSVEKILKSGETSLALDYYRKLCATCHLWKQKGDLPGFLSEKGGGCTACHHIKGETPAGGDPKKTHPLITKKVPTDNCVRCHNRSGRVGISYSGKFEAENYGTPYKNGQLSQNRLPGSRFYLELSDDIHHAKGMACIDCHTRNEIMGNGTSYAHYEEQLEIGCEVCHTSGKKGITRKGGQLNNLSVNSNGDTELVGKLDGKTHPLHAPKAGTCDYAGHKRLSCESCHSAWVPQCYGCHVKRDQSETHMDKLTLKETPGWWQEGRSYIRYEQPMLAVWDKEIVIVTPGCQDIVTLVDKDGKQEGTFKRFTMAALNPHTTGAKGRTCADCHIATKTMGLGEGRVWRENGQWRFTPLYQGEETTAGKTVPLDAYVDIEGTPLQLSSRPNLRPFNKNELNRILRIGLCLECHKTYEDPAYKNYTVDKPCPVYKEE